ncbi:MAG: deoxyribodipyrimidine photo-lyase, partial [Flavobacterium sp.]|nr:deoxyribodipyrimidine photo-lyase [Flavobacterium sp.]
MNIVWFKRDLRLFDNEALFRALEANEQTLLLYIFEPSLLKDHHYSQRHFDFIKQSLVELQNQLKPFQTQILIIESEVVEAFKKINQIQPISTIYSHQETGIQLTFDRDKAVASLCKKHKIVWNEYITNGVKRGLSNRATWKDDWCEFMDLPQFPFQPKLNTFLSKDDFETISSRFKPVSLTTSKNTPFQKGGTSTGMRYLNS